MALTADQIADMRADLGSATSSVFSDDELNRLFTRAEEDYNGAVYLGWVQLMGDATKFINYTVGMTRIERETTFGHIKAMVEFWLACVIKSDPAQVWLRFCGVTTVQGLQVEFSVVLKFIPLAKFNVMLVLAVTNCGEADSRS